MTAHPFTLHTSSHSWSAMSVDLLCQLADVRIDRVQYDLTPGLWQTRSSAKLRLLNPTRRVPVLVRNSDANANANPSFVLTESTAILRYLADDVVAPDSPWRRAADATVRAKIDELLDWWSASVRPAIRQSLDLLSVHDGEDRDQRFVRDLRSVLFGSDDLFFVNLPSGIHAALDRLDRVFLADDSARFPHSAHATHPSIADLPIFVDLYVIELVLKQNLTRFSRLAAWRARIAAIVGDRLAPFVDACNELAEILEAPALDPDPTQLNSLLLSTASVDNADDDNESNPVAPPAVANNNNNSTTNDDDDDDDDSDDDDDRDDKKSGRSRGPSNHALSRIKSLYGAVLTRDEMWKREKALTLEQRRERYYQSSIVTRADLQTWEVQARRLVPLGSVAARPSFDASAAINAKVGLFHGDITRLEIDGIVNAANRSLLGGGGIDGAIHRAAGEKLYCECALLDGANTGECKVTRGYALPAAHVLHCVGPIGEHPDKLKACYINALNAAKNSNGEIRTVAFCGISTGIYGYPIDAAAHVALRTTREWLEDAENAAAVDLLVFVTFLGKEQSTYHELMLKYFPVAWTTAETDAAAEEAADAAAVSN